MLLLNTLDKIIKTFEERMEMAERHKSQTLRPIEVLIVLLMFLFLLAVGLWQWPAGDEWPVEWAQSIEIDDLEVLEGRTAFVTAARDICDTHGALLVIDEVQTGFGRTGTLFACERYGVRPDLLCLAKGIANGAFPMGAVLADAAIAVAVGLHGSTFGGHPVACAAAAATLHILKTEGILTEVRRKGDTLVEAIRAGNPPLVREIRHLGLMVGLELRSRVRPVLAALADLGVLALPAGTKVLRLLPPLTIEDGDLGVVSGAVVRACSIQPEAASFPT